MDQVKVDKLLAYRRKIDQGKTQRSESMGRLKQLKQSLKDEFGCDSIEDAKTKLGKMKSKRDKLQAEFDTKFRELEKEYNERTATAWE